MIEKIENIGGFKLVSNFILVKPDPAYNIVAIDGPEGKKIELTIISDSEREACHYSISGTVIKRPDEIFYFNKYSDEAGSMEQRMYASSIKASAGVKCDHPYQEGDKIYYNYNVQLQCEEENRLIETEEYGIVMLIPVDSIFGYVNNGEIIPVNGYVFFTREQQESEYLSESGLTIIREVKAYEKNFATVVSSSTPPMGYLDGGTIGPDTYEKGDKIIVDKRFGYKMAYDLHADELKSVEVAFLKHIIAKLEEVA
jgi:hypothetical protein